MTETGNDIKCTCCGSSNTRLYARARDIEYFTSESEFRYYLCHDCEVLFIYPQPTAALKTIYPQLYYAYNDGSGNIANKVKSFLDKRFFRKQLGRLTRQKLNVLDIGGGTGTLCDIIRSSDKRISQTQVVDIDPHAAETAMRKGHAFFCGPVENFETSQKYDVILMFNILEHVSDPSAILKKAAQLLAQGGVIILQTPNYKSLDAVLFRNTSWGGYHCPRHWVIFNKKNLLHTAATCGLKPHQFIYTQGAAFWTVSILHMLQKWKLIRADAKRPLIYHPLFGIISMATAAFDFARKPFFPLSQMLVVLKQDEKK